MDISKDSIGHKEQEILIRAIVLHVKARIKAIEGVLIGYARQSIAENEQKYKMRLKEIKTLPEIERDAFVLDVLNKFFEKLNLDHKKRTNLKYDCLQIYERWKEIHRPNKEATAAVKKAAEEVHPNEENELLGDFDSLDLDNFDDLFK